MNLQATEETSITGYLWREKTGAGAQIKEQAFLLHAVFYTFWILNHMTILTSQKLKKKKKDHLKSWE